MREFIFDYSFARTCVDFRLPNRNFDRSAQFHLNIIFMQDFEFSRSDISKLRLIILVFVHKSTVLISFRSFYAYSNLFETVYLFQRFSGNFKRTQFALHKLRVRWVKNHNNIWSISNQVHTFIINNTNTNTLIYEQAAPRLFIFAKRILFILFVIRHDL